MQKKKTVVSVKIQGNDLERLLKIKLLGKKLGVAEIKEIKEK